MNSLLLVLKAPIKFVQLVLLGFYFFSYYVISTILNIFKYILLGFMALCYGVYLGFCKVFKIIHYDFTGFLVLSYGVYKLFKYILYGMLFTFLSIFTVIFKFFFTSSERAKQKRDIKLRKELARKQARDKAIEDSKRKKEQAIEASKRKKEDAVLLKKKKKEKDEYVNENVKIEKKTLGDKINDVLESVFKVPGNIKKSFKDYYNNLDFVKNSRNQKDINHQALLIDFEGADAVKSEKKQLYEYVGKNAEGKTIKGYFAAFSKVEVHSFLLSEGMEVYSIRTNKWIEAMHKPSGGSGKIKVKDLIFFTTQLSTYIKAGIPLVDALKILSRQYKNKNYQRIFRSMIYDLTMGESFSDAMGKQGDAFPRLLINMVKAAEMTGELPESLDDMSNYFTETDATRRQMITAMMYPAIVSVVAVCVIAFILIWVIPQFVSIYETLDGGIPGYTLVVLAASDFLQSYILHIIIGLIIFGFLCSYLYKNVKILRTMSQWIIMHMPVFGKVIIYNEVTMFTKTFASLLKHNVFITDSMEILNKITSNEVYRMLILDTITNLAKGDKISTAFKNHWAFPIPAYEMLVTGEKTGEMPEMMEKVAQFYQGLHKQAVANIKTFIEPALLLFLTVVVGGILLAVIIPMFGTYQSVL